MDEDRLERVSKRITADLREQVRNAFAEGEMPEPLAAAFSQATREDLVEDRAPLELIDDPAALEAIVQRFGRPPLLIRGGQVEMQKWGADLPPDTEGRIIAAQKWIPSVGRVEFRNHDMAWGGTGWVIEVRDGAHIVATNRHVAKKVARRKADGRAVFMRTPSGVPYGAAVDFAEEVGSAEDNAATADVAGLEYLADDLSADVALLRVETAGFTLPDPFELADAEAEKGHLVALIGYPAYDSRNNDGDQSRYFSDLYEVKRFSPGLITQGLAAGAQLQHDCTSLGGSSGSPVLSLEHGKVVGLHFSGKYGKYNAAVSVATLKALLKGQTVIVGDQPAAPDESRADGHHDARLFKGRKGFDPKFLGKPRTPWPRLPTSLAAGLGKPSDKPREPNELRYTHFGVKYSTALKLPLMSAVNIDGQHSVRIKRGDDKWFTDGRLPLEAQLRDDNFADAQIDRGHMVRREDPNWDPRGDVAAATVADGDTFHYVNACAQHSTLNQGKRLWQGLENYILDSARTHGFKACVFTGPVLRPEDSDEDETMIDGAIVPLEFWKLVATLDASGKNLHATAYLLSQGQLVRDLLLRRSRHEALEGFELGAYRTFQISVKDLAEATGYDFATYADADPLARTGAGTEAIDSGEPLVIPLDEPENIIL